MTKHVHLWSSTVFGTATIKGRRVSRYQVCLRRGCKAKRKP